MLRSRFGSTFKVAAASAVMALVQEGVIDLDQLVSDINDSLIFSDQVVAQEITLRQLLSHTSGLDDTDDPEPQPLRSLARLHFVARLGLSATAMLHSMWGCLRPRSRPASTMKAFCAHVFSRRWR